MKNKLSKFIHNLCYINHPKNSYLYGIVDGVYKGTNIIFFDIDESKDTYSTLAIAEDPAAKGGMRIFTIPKTSVKEGFSNGIIQKIKALPQWTTHIFKLEYDARLALETETKKEKD